MTGYEFLKNVRDTDLRIRGLKSELFRLRSDILSLRAIDYSRDKIVTSTNIDISDKIVRLYEATAKLMQEWNTLLDDREMCKAIISRMPSVKQQMVLTEYYINGNTWSMTAKIAGCSYQNIQQKLHKRALRSFDKIYEGGCY